MSFETKHGHKKVKVQPIAPNTDQQVEELMESGEYSCEELPNHFVRRKSDDENVATFYYLD